jgi:tRNA(Ile)-lysidine synthase
MPNLPQHIEKLNRSKKLLRDGQNILVAVSGGLDSMVLLALLHRLAPAHRWHLAVAHFNHQLRGKAADADQRLVRQTAQSLGLPVVVGSRSVKEHARRRGLSLEMAARELRHSFLAQAARKSGASTIALAHHADDQVETFFLRLLRGAGSRGLGGMDWLAPSPADPGILLVRPLLECHKSDLESFAQAHRIPFSEDETNAGLNILRNRVRHELLPLLRKNYQPALNRCVLRMMELARSENALVREMGDQWLIARRRKPFARLAAAVQRCLIQRQLHEIGQPVDFDLVEQLRTNLHQPIAAGPDHCLILDTQGKVGVQTVAKPAFDSASLAIQLSRRRGTAEFGQVKVSWQLADNIKMNPPRRPNAECFDADKVGPAICLRHWRPGDRFHLIGAPSPAKLQDIFTNLKVPRAERHRRVLAATARDGIFWVEGLRIAQGFKLDKKTVRRLNWSWQRQESLSPAGVAVLPGPC